MVHWWMPILQAVPTGQSAGPLHPHAPPAPQVVLPVPCAHWLVVGSQQPPLHATDAEQSALQVWFVWHAWYIGQSAEVAQPHAPCTQWFVPVHGPQAAPFVPHAASSSAVTQLPFSSQQPAAQLAGVHLSVHTPLLQLCDFEHELHGSTTAVPPLPAASLAAPAAASWPPSPPSPAAVLIPPPEVSRPACPPS